MPSATLRRLPLPPVPARRAVPRWAGVMIVLGAVAVLALVFGGAYWDSYQLRREAARLVQERDDLRRQNAQLREEIRLLHTPAYIERLAREQLGLVRPGEIAVILVRPTPAAPAAGEAQDRSGEDGWWSRLRRRWSP